MHTIATSPISAQATPRTHSPAYGRSRQLTSAQKAQFVAESIALKQDEGRPWTWAEYGLAGNLAQRNLVLTALGKLRWTPVEEEQLEAWYWEQAYMQQEEEDRRAATR